MTRAVYVPDVDPQEFIGVITFCTGYNPESHWDSRKLNAGTTKDKLKKAIRLSIKEEGFRNAIIAYSCKRGLMLHYGGTRLRAAIELDVPIPAVIYDSADLYPDAEEVTCINYRDFFTDEPYFWLDHDADMPLESHYGIRARDGVPHKPGATNWLYDDPTGVIEDELLKVREELAFADALFGEEDSE